MVEVFRIGITARRGHDLDLDDQDVELLEHLAEGESLSGAASRMDRAKSTLSARASNLASKGLLEKAGDASNSMWQMTGDGVRALQARSSGGCQDGYRTPVRVHNLRVRAPIVHQPPRRLLHKRLPEGFESIPMRGWEKIQGKDVWAPEDYSVVVQIDLESVAFYVGRIRASPAKGALTALRRAEELRGHLSDVGIKLGSMAFDVAPEYAYPGHPAAQEYYRREGRLGRITDHLWIDKSQGRLELETDRREIATSIEMVGWREDEDLDSWLGRVESAANENPFEQRFRVHQDQRTEPSPAGDDLPVGHSPSHP